MEEFHLDEHNEAADCPKNERDNYTSLVSCIKAENTDDHDIPTTGSFTRGGSSLLFAKSPSLGHDPLGKKTSLPRIYGGSGIV